MSLFFAGHAGMAILGAQVCGPALQAVHGLPATLGGHRLHWTCVIDGVLKHSPADHVRRPHVPSEHTIRSWRSAHVVAVGQYVIPPRTDLVYLQERKPRRPLATPAEQGKLAPDGPE